MSARILIVDDEPFVARALGFLLQRQGFEVHTLDTGAGAVETIRRLRPVLILLDVMLPGASGYQIAEAVKADRKLASIHIVMVSAKGQMADELKGRACGAEDYITKPFSPRAVVHRVLDVLGLPEPASLVAADHEKKE